MGWLPTGTNGNGDGWRLDIVSLLAVIGESAMAEHSQAMTSSWTCMLPRIIPAPQALLKPARPTRLPYLDSAVVGVHNGVKIDTFNVSQVLGLLMPFLPILRAIALESVYQIHSSDIHKYLLPNHSEEVNSP